ncbi:ATP-binding cassette domain-containing protein [Pseudochryseolinea flava]|nr:ATP-binding cassette domain-containing protein [Pseudochryseolinea flava]
MITFHDVTISSRGQIRLKDFNLIIEDNHHYIIRGSNGSGKTTLLESIAGIVHATSGTVEYSFIGSDLTWDERFYLRKQHIHYIPTHALQSTLSTHPEFFYQQRYYTIGDVQLPTVQDFLGAESKFDASTFPASFNIGQLLPLELTRLSNGQLKKVLIIRALMKNIPKVLLLDYPLDGLDSQSRQDLCDFIDHMAKSFSIQVIMTDHGDQLPKIIDRQIVLDKFCVIDNSAYEVEPERAEPTIPKNQQTALNNDKPIVEMQGVRIKYGKHTIIDNLNWKINEGERWALTGRNGSGKTTIFSLIYADHPMAYSEKVFLFGKRRGSGESMWDIKKRITYLGPEQLHYFNAATVSKTARQFLLEEKPSSIEVLLDHFNAHTFIDLPVKDLSSGQLQLLLLMKSFIAPKDLLLLDEPFQFLDNESKTKLNSFLSSQLKAGVTMVMITHDIRDVEHWTQFRLHLQ